MNGIAVEFIKKCDNMKLTIKVSNKCYLVERIEKNMNNLNDFGKILITETRDRAIKNMEKRIDGTMKGITAKLVQEKIVNFTEEQKEILKYLVTLTVDTTLDSFLWMVEEQEKIKIMYDNTNIKEISDGLSGELYAENGWIEKFTTLNKNN